MMYLLDTDVIINHLRGKKEIPQIVLSQGAGLSIISYGELIFGAEKSVHRDKNVSLLTSFFTSFSLEVVNLNKEIMHEFAQIKARLEKSGRRVDDFDLLIAATAIYDTFILVTGNKKHFDRISKLKIYTSF